MHTRKTVADLLNRNDKAVCQGLVRLWDRQTEDEKAEGATKHYNSVGFDATDAEFCSSLASQYSQKGFLSATQTSIGRKKLMKYAAQLAEESNHRQRLGTEVAEWIPDDLRIIVVISKKGSVSEVIVNGIVDATKAEVRVIDQRGAEKHFRTRKGEDFTAMVKGKKALADTEALDFYWAQTHTGG